ncbi:hypothetical protein MIV112R [Invertebrate iridescent virus 3]|uniref:Uncharacterized protein 112R n=1 Tax=Invertebrate iridescent virus 3 TaxID=345201 RepID=VF466_IIV3|nr:hypothetical protein MIV112R [Invertebrate iridescent virus 3]Q196U8.1 RecName: Full=Uncharacterized protein 112R [Invertebrate iridescent virus 3]ABF82142.1 hypothetical protein MIV112R [Invertebrate iridescent virus 3]
MGRQVTPIYPRTNGTIQPVNFPIRNMEPPNHSLQSAGFQIPPPDAQFPRYHAAAPHHPRVEAAAPSCLDVARHVESCPICSRIHDTDKTLYVLVIVGLTILCFLLVKRILKL